MRDRTREIIIAFLIFSFTSYLLSFPNFGPIAIGLVEEHALTNLEFFSIFYLSHILGIGCAAILIDGVRKRITLTKIIGVLLALASVLTFYYLFAIVIVGLLLGFMVVIWGSLLSRVVKPWRRGKILAFGAAPANIYLTSINHLNLDLYQLLFFIVIPPLLLVILPELEVDTVKDRKINFNFIRFASPIVIFYILAGFMYGKMEPVFMEEGIKTHVLFYAAMILIAGYLYDTLGRKIVSISGILLLATSFTVFPVSYLTSAYLIQSSFAFIDIFSMIIWADLSYYGSESRQYGAGVLFITSSILAGFILSEKFVIDYPYIEIILILLLISSILIASAKEPMKPPEEYIKLAGEIVEK